MGRDHPGLRAQIALFEARAGHLDAAIREIERSLALHPTTEAWVLLGSFRERQGDRKRARAAYREALEIAPEYRPALRALTR